MNDLRIYSREDLLSYVQIRKGETKLGELLPIVIDQNSFKHLAYQGVKYAIVGIPEDIGPRANRGRCGASEAWNSFLQYFLNVQVNSYIDPGVMVVLGEVELSDLMKESESLDNSLEGDLVKLRELCSRIDQRVEPLVEAISSSGIIPIVIGGGHNNVYPIQVGVSKALKLAGKTGKIACINYDPHADLREMEGRHSGNGFTYSLNDNILESYFILGLQTHSNSKIAFERIKSSGFDFVTYEDIFVKRKLTFEKAVKRAIDYAKKSNLPVGVDLDLDGIAYLPVSSETPNGISSEDAAYFIAKCKSEISDIAYLHIPEGAPSHAASQVVGDRYVGRTIVNQVLAFVS
ncbi:MAG: arginase family protein [Deltaproteobacteria bacterium]|nr:arginase family protein [Deltaproteobacteria bacterium]